MVQRTRLQASLWWRAIGRLESGQFKIDGTPWLVVNGAVVYGMWPQFIEPAILSRKPWQGRPCVTSEKFGSCLGARARWYSRITAQQLASDLVAFIGRVLSRNQRTDGPAEWPLLSETCCMRTYDAISWKEIFRVESSTWTVEQWVNVLFTDYSWVCLESTSRWIRIWMNVEHDFGPQTFWKDTAIKKDF